MKKLLLIICGLFLLAACIEKEKTVQTGPVKFPVVTAKELKDVIASKKGRVLVVNFFATWCPPCRKEVPELVQLYETYQNKDVLFIGVSVDEAGDEVLRPFAEKARFNYPVFLAQPDVINDFQISSIPNTLVFDKNNKLAKSAVGYVSQDELKSIIDKLLPAGK